MKLMVNSVDKCHRFSKHESILLKIFRNKTSVHVIEYHFENNFFLLNKSFGLFVLNVNSGCLLRKLLDVFSGVLCGDGPQPSAISQSVFD